MFQLMGFKNIAVLDGGFPEWKIKGFTDKPNRILRASNYQKNKIMTKAAEISINNETICLGEAVVLNASSKEKPLSKGLISDQVIYLILLIYFINYY